jgi:hypothetical protein
MVTGASAGGKGDDQRLLESGPLTTCLLAVEVPPKRDAIHRADAQSELLAAARLLQAVSRRRRRSPAWPTSSPSPSSAGEVEPPPERRARANLNSMSDQKQPPADEPKQKTLKGYEIPLPRRGEIFSAFKKIVAKPKKG